MTQIIKFNQMQWIQSITVLRMTQIYFCSGCSLSLHHHLLLASCSTPITGFLAVKFVFSLLFFLQVAIKIIDKTQLNPTSLQKVNILGLLLSYKISVRLGSLPPVCFTIPLSAVYR